MGRKKSATNVTVAQRASHSTSETIVISEADAAKIRKDAETAIGNDEKLHRHRVYHGSGADFDAFDHRPTRLSTRRIETQSAILAIRAARKPPSR